MADLRKKIDAERRLRELLDESGLPQPGSVEYGEQCIRLFWHDSKTVVVIDLDEPPQDGRGLELQNLEARGD